MIKVESKDRMIKNGSVLQKEAIKLHNIGVVTTSLTLKENEDSVKTITRISPWKHINIDNNMEYVQHMVY